MTMDPESRSVVVDGNAFGTLCWHEGRWRLVVHGSEFSTSIPWAVIEAVTRFKTRFKTERAKS
jgi:hypothetical protein